MAAPQTYKWQDVRKLVTYGDKNFEYKEIEKKGLGEETAVPVENGVGARVKVEIGTENADKTLYVFCWETMRRSR